MLSPRDNYLIAANGGMPEYVPSFMDDSVAIFPSLWTDRDEDGRDFLGVRWIMNDAGEMPDHSPDALTLKDIRNWRDVLVFPDLEKLDWDAIVEKDMARCSPDKAKIGMLYMHGPFMIPVNLMGWTEALCAVYDEPDELHAMIDTITDFIVEYVGYQKKYYDPDIMFTGDDITNANGPFITKDVWREFYEPSFKRIVDAIHDVGCLAQWHCCGVCDDYIDEFLDLGIDVAELWPETEKLLKAKEEGAGRWSLVGGFDRQGPGSAPGAPEEVVRQAVREGIERAGKNGGFMFWDGGVVGSSQDAQNKRAWIADELSKYRPF